MARVLITGMGGELGTRVALLLEEQKSIEAIAGLDIDPPRRRLRRTEFHRVDPRDRARMVQRVREFEPTCVVHLGVYEPNARSTPRGAADRTAAGSIAALGAAAESGTLESIVVRSGLEIYGRRRNSATRPDESVAPDPTTAFAHSLLHTESVASAAAAAADVPVTALRFASLVGPHFPSPLGRYLRMPAVPVSALNDSPFSLLHQEDAAQSILAAVKAKHDGPLNVVGPGAVTALQAARLGNRLPIPTMGPGWRLARRVAELAGAPVPDHVFEMLTRGRTADGSQARSALDFEPRFRTPDVVRDLFEWASVTYLRALDREAA